VTSSRETRWRIAIGVAGLGAPARAAQVLTAPTVTDAITVDGEIAEWRGIEGITVPLTGRGGVSSVTLKAAIYGDSLYVLAVWDDPTEDTLYMPYRWDRASQSYYRQTGVLEDRFALTLRISGTFSGNMVDGSAFEADTWHWMAAGSNPAGIAHDKYWRVGPAPFPMAKAIRNMMGKSIYIMRMSDAGGPLHKPVTYDVKVADVMPSYEINRNLRGSIADIKAKGVWRDGRWYLEMVRRLDTGNPDDAVIPARGRIEFGVALLNAVSGGGHSYSDKLVLETGGPPS
jgi:hypothetical protein